MSFSIIFIGLNLKFRKSHKPIENVSVDVFITTYNEPVEVIRRTVLGACQIRYPHHTWILDDGNRQEIKDLAEQYGCHYLARENNVGAKAGNLNNGLKHANGEFVVLFDADHVAEINFLDKTLGYFRDPLIAFVQTPQDYYNIDAFQFGRNKSKKLIWHDQSWFNYIGQTGRDYWGAATLCGSSAVIRRSMLDEIGGFPTETVTEDMHCAVKLQKKGYKTAYHAEPLAYGIAPVDLGSYLKQRLRWGEGNLQVCREENLPFTNSLTLAQRLSYFFLTTNYLAAWQKVFYYVLPIYVLFTQVSPILTDPLVFFIYFVPYMLLGIILIEEMGRGYGRYLATDLFSMAQVAIGIGATFGLIRKNIKFRVTSKVLKGDLPFFLLLPYVTIVVISLLAIAITLIRYITDIDIVMPFGVALLLILFAAINVGLALAVILNAYRCSKLSEIDYSFNIPLIADLAMQGDRYYPVFIDEIATNHFYFYSNILIDDSKLNDLVGNIYIPNKTVPVTGEVILKETVNSKNDEVLYKYLFLMKWDNTEHRDVLDLSLVSCRWHRLITRKEEYIKTPLDLLIEYLSESKNSIEKNSYTPVLYQVNNEAKQLAYISNLKGESQQLITFEKLNADALMKSSIISNGDIDLSGLNIVHEDSTVLIDESIYNGLYIEKHTVSLT